MRLEGTEDTLGSRMGKMSSLRLPTFPGSAAFLERLANVQWLLAGWCLVLSIVLAQPVLAARDDSKVLREQATRFWEARVRGDWATVYDYLSEEERAGQTKEKYVETSKASGPWRYLHYRMGSVEASDNMGWVKIEYSVEPVMFPGIKPRHSDHWQKWEKVDGKWTLLFAKRNGEFPQLPPSLRPLEEEKAVMKRADKMWKAREHNDYTAVYHLCEPSFRKQVSLDEWLTKRSQNLYLGHEILWAEVKGDRAVVRISFEYRPDDPALTKMDPMKDATMQNWIKVDGQWYLNVSIPADE